MNSNCENLHLQFTRSVKQRRRSSILKTSRPFDELQNISNRDDKMSRDRRVSFANTIKIKEFVASKASEQEQNIEGAENEDGVETADLPECETTIQISTPKEKKCRRISFNTGSKIERLSLIPKLDQSFSLNELDEDFEVFDEDSEASLPSLAQAEVVPQAVLDPTLTTNCQLAVAADHKLQATQSIKDDEVCYMELTNCETNVHANLLESFSLCSPESLLKPLRASETANHNVHLDAVVHQSIVPCEPSATNKEVLYTGDHTNEKLSNVTMDITCEDNAILETNSDMYATENDKKQLPLSSVNEVLPYCAGSHVLKYNNTTMDRTCADSALVGTNSDMHSIKNGEIQPGRICGTDVICIHDSSYQDSSNDQDAIGVQEPIPLTSATLTNAATDELGVVMSGSQHTEVIVRNLLKTKQRKSKSGFLVTSPYLEQHTHGGSVHSRTYVLNERSLQCNTVMCVDNSVIQDSGHEENSQSSRDQVCEHATDKTNLHDEEVDLTTGKRRVCPSLGESLFPEVNYEGDKAVHVCNWLEYANNDSFALVDSKSPSQTHTDSGYLPSQKLSSAVRCVQSLASSIPLHTKFEAFTFQKAVSTIKANTEPASGGKLEVESPEMVTIQKKSELSSSDYNVSLNSVSSLEDISAYREGDIMRQSVMMSPSVFSKFITMLKCDRSSLCVNKPHIVKGVCSPCDISVLSSSRVHADIDKNEKQTDETCTHHFSRRKQNKTGPLSVLLEMLRERVLIVLTSLELRIHSKDYLQAHQSVQPCLQRLIAAANRCVCVVNVLHRFGQLSGLSREPFNLSLLDSVPQMHSSVSDLLGDRQTKANWIQNVHHYMEFHVYPTVESILHEIASVFPWHINKWTETEMEINCHHCCVLKLDLVKQIHGSICVQAIHVVSVEGNSIAMQDLVCSTTDDIPQMLQNICSCQLD